MKKLYFPAYPGVDIGTPVGPIDLDPAESESAATPSAASNPNEIIPTPANGMLHDLIWGVKKIVDADAVAESWETLFEGEVTTEKEAEEAPFARGPLDAAPSADTIKVTFNGAEYTCEKLTADDGVAYGGVGEIGPDFSQYPFAIVDGNLYTESAGTFSLKIEEPGQSGGGSSDFSIANVTVNVTRTSGTNPGVINLYLPVALENESNNLRTLNNVVSGYSTVIPVILYKGRASAGDYIRGNMFTNITGVQVSGNATIDETALPPAIIITGDAVINVTITTGGTQ